MSFFLKSFLEKSDFGGFSPLSKMVCITNVHLAEARESGLLPRGQDSIVIQSYILLMIQKDGVNQFISFFEKRKSHIYFTSKELSHKFSLLRQSDLFHVLLTGSLT